MELSAFEPAINLSLEFRWRQLALNSQTFDLKLHKSNGLASFRVLAFWDNEVADEILHVCNQFVARSR